MGDEIARAVAEHGGLSTPDPAQLRGQDDREHERDQRDSRGSKGNDALRRRERIHAARLTRRSGGSTSSGEQARDRRPAWTWWVWARQARTQGSGPVREHGLTPRTQHDDGQIRQVEVKM